MAVEVPSREAAVRVMRDARARLEALITNLNDAQLERPATLGGGSWSVKDLIGHLASWEERALPWLESADSCDPRSIPATDDFNAAEVDRKSGWALDEVRAEAREVHQQLLDSIERLDDEAWLADVPVPGREPHPRGVRVGMILAGDEHGLFAHDLAHLNDVEAYVEQLSASSADGE